MSKWRSRRDRINTYYAADEQPYALNLLNVLSATDNPLQFDAIFHLLKARLVTEDSERARAVLDLLQRDHYVVLEKHGTYRFRFLLIRRCWRLHRGLL